MGARVWLRHCFPWLLFMHHSRTRAIGESQWLVSSFGLGCDELANAGAIKQAAAFERPRFTNAHRADFPLSCEIVEMRSAKPEQGAGGAMICKFRQCCHCRRLWREGCSLHFEDQHYSPTFQGVRHVANQSGLIGNLCLSLRAVVSGPRVTRLRSKPEFVKAL